MHPEPAADLARMAPEVYPLVDRVHLMSYDILDDLRHRGPNHSTREAAQQAANELVASGLPSPLALCFSLSGFVIVTGLNRVPTENPSGG